MDDDDEFAAILAQAEAADVERTGKKKRSRTAQPRTEEIQREKQSKKYMEDKTSLGSRLLAKIGFEGTVGKTFATNQAPIEVSMRAKNAGLGKEEEAMKEAKVALDQSKQVYASNVEDYRDRKYDHARLAAVGRKFRASLKLCARLDEQKECESEWSQLHASLDLLPRDVPIHKLSLDDRAVWNRTLADDATTLVPDLENVIIYMRSNHFYCFWCGAKFSDKKDLELHCPGVDEEAHD